MKFGHNLPRNQVPEWATSYIDYKSLKKLIKSAAFEAQNGRVADLAGKTPHEVMQLRRYHNALSYSEYANWPRKSQNSSSV